jgi:hypothetical protein
MFRCERPLSGGTLFEPCYSLFIHLIVCLTTGPKPLPKRALHIARSCASSFKWEYPLLSLRSSNSFLRLLPCLLVTSIPPCIFPSVTRFRRQFLRKMWPIQFAFRLLKLQFLKWFKIYWCGSLGGVAVYLLLYAAAPPNELHQYILTHFNNCNFSKCVLPDDGVSHRNT